MVYHGLYCETIGYQPYRQAIGCCLIPYVSVFFRRPAMDTPALPAPGGNATAALALANPGPDEVAINTGDTTTEGDMSYVDDDFDPFPRNDPRRSTP